MGLSGTQLYVGEPIQCVTVATRINNLVIIAAMFGSLLKLYKEITLLY